MATPEIKAYVAARAEWDRKMTAGWGKEDARREVSEALSVRIMAWEALGTGKSWWGDGDASVALDPGEPSPIEDEFVFLPLLVDEYNGDDTAAQIAWHLGQRPAGYPKEDQ